MMNFRNRCVLLICVISACLLISCQAKMPDEEPWVEARPLDRHHPAYQATRDTDHPVDSYATVEPVGTINLDDAIAVALRRNPSLAAASFDARISEAEILQAGIRPNPELAVRLDDFGGTGDNSGFEQARLRLMLRQDLELGGKRDKRIDLAEAERDLAGWDYETMRLSVASETRRRFAAVWVAQQRVKVYEQMLENAAATKKRVDEQMAVGAMKRLDSDKSVRREVEAKVGLEQAKRELTGTRNMLAAMWGSRDAKFITVSGELDQIIDLPLEQEVYNLAHQNPLLARWASEIAMRESELALEQANAVPDVTARAGYRWDTGSDSSDILLDMQVPLPLTDKNQGDILGARYELLKAKATHRAAASMVYAEISQAYQAAAAAAYEAKMIRDHVQPVADATYQAVDEAFAAGVGSLNDLLDAQREVIRSQEDYYDALLAYHEAAAALEGLVGQNITSP